MTKIAFLIKRKKILTNFSCCKAGEVHLKTAYHFRLKFHLVNLILLRKNAATSKNSAEAN